MDWLTDTLPVPVWLWVLVTTYLVMGSPKYDHEKVKAFGRGWRSIWHRHILGDKRWRPPAKPEPSPPTRYTGILEKMAEEDGFAEGDQVELLDPLGFSVNAGYPVYVTDGHRTTPWPNKSQGQVQVVCIRSVRTRKLCDLKESRWVGPNETLTVTFS